MHATQRSVQSAGQSRPGTVRRRTVLAAAGLAAPFLPRFARAAQFSWRIGHSAPPDFALHLRLKEAAAAIATRSEGQMAVEVYPNSELGSPIGLLAQVRAGTVDGVPLTSQMLSKDLSIASLPTVGFAFNGYAQLWPAIDGGLGTYIRFLTKERLGLVAMDRCWDFGFRQITTAGKPVNAAGDMAGLRLRTPPEAEFITLFQALKALPVPMPLSALEKALNSHSVDGQDSVLPLVVAAGLFRYQSLCALTNHVWDGQWLCVSGKSWAALPDKVKDMVAGSFNEAAMKQRQDVADTDRKIRDILQSNGMTFNTPDPAGFRSVLRQSGYYATWQARMGDDGWAALTKYTGKLA